MPTHGAEPTAELAEVLGALSHPVRIRVLRHSEGGVKLSASRLRESMPDVPLGTLAYHVRQLAVAGLLRRAGRVPRRGAVEHLYLVTPKGLALVGVLDELIDLIRGTIEPAA
jgi:DNA-binding transcriptional ArsR family regulator